ELFTEERVGGWIDVYERLLEIVAGEPEIRLRDLSERLLQEAAEKLRRELGSVGLEERDFLLRGLNPEPVVYPEADRCLHELFEEQVRRSPAAPALAFGTTTLTYSELDARASALAVRLTDLGAGPEILVGICMERSCELLIGLLGILKAGAAYVPLDPSYPQERLEAMIEDLAEIDPYPLIVTREQYLAALPERVTAGAGRLVLLSAQAPAPAGLDASPSLQKDSGHLIYAIFTSGSTGRPKGAMNSHRGVVNRLLWMQQTYNLTPGERVLQKTPFSFDVSVWELFWPLLCGATVVVAEPERHKDSAYLVRVLREERITTAHFVPSLLRVFLEEPDAATCRSLRRVICSGEALSPDLVERFFQVFSGGDTPELHNLYGPTEAAVDVTAWQCVPGSARIPIGRPVANTRIHLLGPSEAGLQPVPFGTPGELFIGGVQVGRGYLGRPDLTAERFLPDPFSPDPGRRLYRTGDSARYLPDGTVEYLGRLDHQVKIRGIRIEPGEIETVLRGHPGVRDAVVVDRELAPGDRRLVAYAVTREAAAPTAGELRRYLDQRLPDAMVPSQIVRLPALPLTPSGKVDRRALPIPEPERPELEVAFVAPRTPTEQLLAAIWSDLLQLDAVGVHDDFFQLGGDSILAVQVTARANRSGLRLLPMQLFQHPTVASLAAQAAPAGTPGIEPAAPVAGLGERVTEAVARQLPAAARIVAVYPLSPIQQGMLFHSVERQDPNRYILQLSSLLAGELDVAALRASWQYLMDRHSIFRSAFLWEGLD
ncbi:MAG TPA: amino acid adenylation domain-containing protein, partial [Thermoanaerobaculia bacterium]|nr:amino acid adenylation domain-containing protein [Thermoanaerobaculia bacterium]